jgi:hypothetical protein
LNHEFVAFHVSNVAVAELEVKHPVADRVGRHCSGGFCNELTLDRQRGGATGRTACAALGRASGSLARARSVGEMARANCGSFDIVSVLVTRGCEWRGMLAVVDILVFLVELTAPAPLRALPTRRAIARAECSHGVEAGTVVPVG